MHALTCTGAAADGRQQQGLTRHARSMSGYTPDWSCPTA